MQLHMTSSLKIFLLNDYSIGDRYASQRNSGLTYWSYKKRYYKEDCIDRVCADGVCDGTVCIGPVTAGRVMEVQCQECESYIPAHHVVSRTLALRPDTSGFLFRVVV